MTLTVTVEGVDIASADRQQASPTVYSGYVRLKINPISGLNVDPMQMSVPFVHAVSLTQGITQALNDLRDYGEDLKQAAQQAAVVYK